MDIKKFLSIESNKDKFNRLSIGKNNNEIRNLEMKLLKPEKNTKYSGEKPKYMTSLERKTVKIVFSKESDFNLFKKYFNILSFGELNVSNINLLIDFLNLLENGKILYDKEKRKFEFR